MTAKERGRLIDEVVAILLVLKDNSESFTVEIIAPTTRVSVAVAKR